MRQPGVGDHACRCGFPLEMSGMRASDHGGAEAGGEKYQRAEKARRPASKIEKAEKKVKRKNTKKAAKSP